MFVYMFVSLINNQAYSNENIKNDIDNSIKTNNKDQKKNNINVYELPYSFWDNNIDYRRFKANVYTVLGASVVALGLLYIMPESFTNWDKSEIAPDKLFSKWWDNVSSGPVMDEDDFFLNYVTHPYWGAAYYMSARSSGASAPYSFLFSFIASTFFWEYGVEAFAEVPSIQDLIITPVIGSIIGEGFYLSKRHILSNDYNLLNSKILGHVAVFLMDPINEVASLFIKDSNAKNDLIINSFPAITSSGNLSYNIAISFRF